MPDPRSSRLGAVIVAIIDEKTGRLVLVWDFSKSDTKWKFAGGGIEKEDCDPASPNDAAPYDTAARAARREAMEETGVVVRKIRLLKTKKGIGHAQYVYLGLGDFAAVSARGTTGELAKAFSLEQVGCLKRLGNFLPAHEEILDSALRYLMGR